MTTLEYKLKNDPYYKDVQLNPSTIYVMPNQPTNISSFLCSVTTSSLEPHQSVVDFNYDPDVIFTTLTLQHSSFVPTLQNSCIEVEHICANLHLTHSYSTCSLDWLAISLSPVNE